MKMSDGLFHKIFDEIAAEYPDIQNEHWIVDIGAAKLADTPAASRRVASRLRMNRSRVFTRRSRVQDTTL
jgi:hypothetical protein